MRLPSGYVDVASGSVRAFAWDTAASWLEATLGEGSRLHQWAARQDDVKSLVGRGPVYAVSAPAAGPDARPKWAVRSYRRGGMAAPILGDRYLAFGPPRPFHELWVTAEARARGVPAPAVVAGAAYPVGPFYRADLVTELVPSARTLAALFFTGGDEVDRLGLLDAAGSLARTLREARVFHADLNASNVLIVGEAGAYTAWVVDLDRSKVLPLDGPRPSKVMRRRLERSLTKLSEEHGRAITEEEWGVLHAAFGDD